MSLSKKLTNLITKLPSQEQEALAAVEKENPRLHQKLVGEIGRLHVLEASGNIKALRKMREQHETAFDELVRIVDALDAGQAGAKV